MKKEYTEEIHASRLIAMLGICFSNILEVVRNMRTESNIEINNIVCLLEECLINGNSSKEALYAWFLSEQHLIKTTVENLIELTYEKDGILCLKE